MDSILLTLRFFLRILGINWEVIYKIMVKILLTAYYDYTFVVNILIDYFS